MNDLLSETSSAKKAGNPYDDDLETGPSVQMTSMGGDKDLTRFFADIEKIKTQMESIRELLAKLQEANEESKGVHRAQAMKALRDRMDADIAQVTKIARAIKGELEQLDNGNIASRRVKGCEEGTPTDRTRTTITNNQRKKLKDLMGEFQALRERMNSLLFAVDEIHFSPFQLCHRFPPIISHAKFSLIMAVSMSLNFRCKPLIIVEIT
jgi:syntaxin 1B/2/3